MQKLQTLVSLRLIVFTSVGFVLLGCQSLISSSDSGLATPESSCQVSSPSWQNIKPGLSNMEDVINALGEPLEKGRLPNQGSDYFLYSPAITYLRVTYGNLIVFTSEGVVAWIDVWVSNSDGSFHSIVETVHQYGSTLDRGYINGVLDMYGPDQVYVWSECGVAVTVVDSSFLKRTTSEILPLTGSPETLSYVLKFRYPASNEYGAQSSVSTDLIVIRQFLFEPTSFEMFLQDYEAQIPYLRYEGFFRAK